MLSSTLHVFARCDVHGNVIPFVGRDFGKTAFLQRFARRYDLHDAGVTGFKIALHRLNGAWRLHGGDQVIEEALLGAFES